MPKGGARINSGPPPDPNALRRDRPSDKDGWTTLPSEGRTGECPPWPLPRRYPKDDDGPEEWALIDAAAETEGDFWAELWSTPQAVVWEKLRWTREVAMYARLQIMAELGDLDAGKEARQWSDRLGLNPAAMLRLRWRILPTPADVGPAPVRTASRSRGRLKVVKDANLDD